MGQGVIILAATSLLVMVLDFCGLGASALRQLLTLALMYQGPRVPHCSTKFNFTQQPWCWGNSHPLLYVTFIFFSLLGWKCWWKFRLGWLEIWRNSPSEMDREAIVNKHWYEKNLFHLSATTATKRWRQQMGLWASEEGDMREVQNFGGSFATQQSKWNISIQCGFAWNEQL